MITAGEISERLARQAESVAQKLLPGGKRDGREYVSGSTGGDAGKSLKVCISGDKAGLWSDFATGEAGDLLDLWAATRGISVADALREARDYLGIAPPAFAGSKPREYRKPERPAVTRPKLRVLEYLHGRGLTDDTIAAFRVAASPDDDEIVFPFLRGSELVNVKYLKLERLNGKKVVRQEKDAEPCLFGWQAIPDRARSVVLTEGEIDAMTWHQMGFPALSAWSGAGNLQWVENEWDRLARFDRIYVAFDADEAGEAGANAVVARIGRARCRLVTTPYKDANECLQNGLDRACFRDMVDAARSLDPKELRSASTYREAVLARFFPAEGEQRRLETPFEKLTARGVGFLPGELVLVNGINGHGKALALDTPIPTPSGWTSMGEVKVGDVLYDESGAPCAVTAATDVMHGRDCFTVRFNDGTRIVADADHRWLTKSQLCLRSERNALRNPSRNKTGRRGCQQAHKRARPSIVTTREIAHTLRHRAARQQEVSNHAIPVSAHIQCPEASLPLDPYLLGLWLGDGTTTAGAVTTADEGVVEAFRFHGFVTVRRISGNGLTHGVRGLQPKLRAMGVLGRKHVPAAYLRASPAQRLALLQGLMDTDGSCTPYGRCELTSCNEGLARGALELALSLGILAKMITGRATLRGKDCGPKYRITFTTALPVFRLLRKARRLPAKVSTRATHRFIVGCQATPSVPVRCIAVDSPSRLFLCGREFIPTHNTSFVSQVALSLLWQGAKCCIASMEVKPDMLLQRMTIQACASPEPSRPFIEYVQDYWDGRLWMFDVVGTAKAEYLLDVFRYARACYGVACFVVDSFAKCGIDDDDYTAQKRFVEALCDFKNETDSTVFLVTHSRKLESETRTVDKMDIKGSGAFADLADTVTTLWRNKSKEARRTDDEDPTGAVEDKPDAVWYWQKNRNGDFEKPVALWFHAPTRQFLGNSEATPRAFVSFVRDASAQQSIAI